MFRQNVMVFLPVAVRDISPGKKKGLSDQHYHASQQPRISVVTVDKSQDLAVTSLHNS